MVDVTGAEGISALWNGWCLTLVPQVSQLLKLYEGTKMNGQEEVDPPIHVCFGGSIKVHRGLQLKTSTVPELGCEVHHSPARLGEKQMSLSMQDFVLHARCCHCGKISHLSVSPPNSP